MNLTLTQTQLDLHDDLTKGQQEALIWLKANPSMINCDESLLVWTWMKQAWGGNQGHNQMFYYYQPKKGIINIGRYRRSLKNKGKLSNINQQAVDDKENVHRGYHASYRDDSKSNYKKK